MRRDQVSLVCRCKRSADGPRGADLWIRWLTDRFPIHPLPSPISEDFPGVRSSLIKNLGFSFLEVDDFGFVSELHVEKGYFYSQPTFGSSRRSNLSGGGGIRICILFFSGPELSSAPADSKMKSVAVWMCIHIFLLLIGEMCPNGNMMHLSENWALKIVVWNLCGSF